MSWQGFITLSILLYSVNGLLHRTLMKHVSSDPYAQTVAFMGLVCLSSLVISLFHGGLQTSFSLYQILLFIPIVILSTLGTIYAFKSIKLIEASEYTILITSSKLWFIAGTLLILREAFSMQKIIGGILILIGVTISQWRMKKFVFNEGVLYVLLAACFYAFNDIFSFLLLRNFDALSLIVYSTSFSTIALLVIKPQTIQKLSFYRKPERLANIIFVSVNDTLASLFSYLAYQVGRNALQIGPLGATQTMLTVFLAMIILKETDHMTQKILGAITVVVGAAMVI